MKKQLIGFALILFATVAVAEQPLPFDVARYAVLAARDAGIQVAGASLVQGKVTYWMKSGYEDDQPKADVFADQLVLDWNVARARIAKDVVERKAKEEGGVK